MGEDKVTAEALKRFHAGLSSVEEQAAVQVWLEESDDELSPLHSPEEEEEIGRKLWTAVARSTIHKQKKIRFGYFRYGIAASLFMATCIIFYFHHFSDGVSLQQQQLVSTGNSGGRLARGKSVDGLVLINFPKGGINATKGFINGRTGEDTSLANVSFCDMMVVQNKSVGDVTINFSSDCSTQTVKPTKFRCKKGNSYVALRLSPNSSEIIVVDERYVDDMLPLHVAMRVNRDIKSI